VYHTWLLRNAIVHFGHIIIEDQICKLIKKDVEIQIENKGCFEDNILNRILCCNWGINNSTLLRRKT
jgi:hypothetical protein